MKPRIKEGNMFVGYRIKGMGIFMFVIIAALAREGQIIWIITSLWINMVYREKGSGEKSRGLEQYSQR